ncbi:hypothetical protein HaLaN_12910 [Haematococcus lacustris]|uniref:Uncharacterized protein n=1 Tax=Haematococcus lacustris TaxID=44745 RepID=A0A699Z4J2_HAELA|nr:hypothetical protein HaLaN_12910 [Haematococcus lacustris]
MICRHGGSVLGSEQGECSSGAAAALLGNLVLIS